MFWYNIKLSIRTLKANKLYSFLTISGYAIGFAVCLTILLFVYGEVTVDRHFKNHEHIYRLYETNNNICQIDYEITDFLKEIPEIEKHCPLKISSSWEVPVKSDETALYIEGLAITTNDFFDIFSIPVIKKLYEQPFGDINSVAISELLAEKLFPDKDPLGQEIIVRNEINLIISSVYKDFPENSSLRPKLIFNFENKDVRFSTYCNNGRCTNPSQHYLKVKTGIEPKIISQKLNISLNGKITFVNDELEVFSLQPLKDVYLDRDKRGEDNFHGNKTLLKIFALIAFVILILSVVNNLNFAFSMQLKRLRENSVKIINGARFMQIAIYQCIESTMVIAGAFILSIILAALFLPYASVLLNKTLDLFNLFKPILIVPVVFLVLLISMVVSIVPSIILFRKIINVQTGKYVMKGEKQRGRMVLNIFQMVASIILIIGLITMQHQLRYIKHRDMGFKKEHLLFVRLESMGEKARVFYEEILKSPYIKKATLCSGIPGEVNTHMGSAVDDNHFSIACLYVDTSFIQTMNIELLEGRNFLGGDNKKACIMNETAMKAFGWESCHGKRYYNYSREGLEVIGVAKDFHVESVHDKIEPVCLIFDDSRIRQISLRLHGANIVNAMAYLQNTWFGLFPDEPFDYRFFDEMFDAMYKQEERQAKTIGLFSMIAILITCLGLFGQIFHSCLIRTKEVGIRKVNGARIIEIITLLNKEFIVWIIIAFIIASPVARYIMDKWLENFAYKQELSLWVFIMAGAVALGIALITVSSLSWQAARRNPVEALRYE